MKIGIAVFSGTGNTTFIAQLIAKNLGESGASVDIYTIDARSLSEPCECHLQFIPAKYDIVGIGHPVLGFGATPLVLRFAKALPAGTNRFFVFKTAADNHHINNCASEKLINILIQKGYDVFHDCLYLMPCNWLVAYRREFNLQIIDRAHDKAKRHTEQLLAGTRSSMTVYPGWRRLARFFHYLESRLGRKQFGKALRIQKGCTYCGLCVKSCPTRNITEHQNGIRFGDYCIWCMRCIYSCPAKAIAAPGMNWCILKKGYRLKELLAAPDQQRSFITTESRGYWRHFREYFFEKSDTPSQGQ
jgi:ferredoxin